MTSRYPFERVDYPLLQGIRFRRQVLTWGLGLVAWSLLLGSTLLVEERDLRLHWARTVLITSGAITAILGRLALEDSVKVGRAMLDHEDVADAARQQLLWHEGTDAIETPAIDVTPVATLDPWEYLSRAGREWRTHLAVLSPTDTGKSAFLYLLLGVCSRARPTCVQVVEGKGADWAGVPDENIVRINFRPSMEDAHALCARLHKTLDLVQNRVNAGQWDGPQLVFVLEEYLALSSGLKRRKGVFEPYGRSLDLGVEAMAAVARGGGGQMVLISQSPNADDLKFSGGVRSNFRIACLGSRLGGFDAIERMIDNYNFVNKRERERIEAEYQSAKRQLFTERHPLILTNLLGQWVCFPLPYLNDQHIAALNIASEVVPPELLNTGDWFPGEDEADGGGSYSLPADKAGPSSYTLTIDPETEPESLEEIENLIIEVLKAATEPLKAHQIKSKRQKLKDLEGELFRAVLAGLVMLHRIDQTQDEPPRYTLPPDSSPTG
ncbi:MAG: hypothetical protein KME14_21135 [Tildeniella torsiva UHER 1998/13D]|jgi:hypothetical protein|nr:hypothetical protein [Tildeniella torsiva UHER 1998/13D]